MNIDSEIELLNVTFKSIQNAVMSCTTKTYFISLYEGHVNIGIKSLRRKRQHFKKDMMMFYKTTAPPMVTPFPASSSPETLRDVLHSPIHKSDESALLLTTPAISAMRVPGFNAQKHLTDGHKIFIYILYSPVFSIFI